MIHLKIRGGALSVGFLKIRTLMDMVVPCAVGNSFFRNLMVIMVVRCAILCRIINSFFRSVMHKVPSLVEAHKFYGV